MLVAMGSRSADRGKPLLACIMLHRRIEITVEHILSSPHRLASHRRIGDVLANFSE